MMRKAAARGALLSCVLLLVVFATAAQAATSYRNVGNFGTGTIPNTPTAVAVDAVGNVLVPSDSRLLVFGPEPEASLITEFVKTEANFYSVAVDPSSGAIYLTDRFGSEITGPEIIRLTSDGASPPTYSVDNTYPSPPAGEEAGQVSSFESQIAVDPGNGDLLIADRGAQRVSRFKSDGSFVSSFNGSDRPEGPFTALRDVTVAPNGDVYTVESTVGFYGDVSGGRIDRFDAAGTFQERIGAAEANAVVSLAYDPTRDNLVASNQGGAFSEMPPGLQVYNAGELTDQLSFPADTKNATAPDLAFNVTTGRLYGLTGWSYVWPTEKASVQAFDPVVIAETTISAPDQVTATGARFSGTVNPVGKPTSYRFEYSSDGGKTWQSTPEGSAGEGEAPVPVEATVTALEPNTDYLVRLRADNAEASDVTAAQAFATSVAPPGATTLGPVEVTTSKATLRGTVNPFGLATTYHFEYGTTTAYGSRVPVGLEEPAGQGRQPLPVEHLVEGLQPNTTYHYRLVAESSAGISYGEDRTFTTTSAAAAERVYELVSQTDKGGSRVDPLWAHANANGDSIVFQTKTAIPGLSESAPVFPRYFAGRGSDAWSVRGLDPPAIQTNQFHFWYSVLAISDDGTKAVVISPKKLAPGAGEGDSNIYLRDIATGAYTTIGVAPGLAFWFAATQNESLGNQTVLGGTADFSKVMFRSELVGEFIPGAALQSVYEWSAASGLRVVAENARSAATPTTREPNVVSADGSTIFYVKQTESFEYPIWAEVDGEDIDVSGGVTSELVGASADGRYAFTQATGAIWRYDLEARERTKIAADLPSQEAGLQVSRDGSRVYYLKEDGTMWLWDDGEAEMIVDLEWPGLENRRASPSGRYFFFSNRESLTGFDNEGTKQFYLYDAETDELVCASCRTDGESPTGDASVGEGGAQFEHWIARSVLDNGEAFFDTPDPLVPADVNSSRDVYAFDGSQVRLISAGTGNGPSQFADASESGRDVFFTTQDRLVAIDTDAAADMYDARIGGGLPGQQQGPPEPPCTGEGCRGAAAPAPRPGRITTEAAGDEAKPKPRKKRCRSKGKARAKSKAKAKARCGKAKAKGKNAKGKGKQNKRNNGRSGR